MFFFLSFDFGCEENLRNSFNRGDLFGWERSTFDEFVHLLGGSFWMMTNLYYEKKVDS